MKRYVCLFGVINILGIEGLCNVLIERDLRDLRDITNIRNLSVMQQLLVILAAWSSKLMDVWMHCGLKDHRHQYIHPAHHQDDKFVNDSLPQIVKYDCRAADQCLLMNGQC
jgi:hypothetical protein